MAGVQGSRLAVAVAGAGGLGSLPGAMLGADALRNELQALRDAGVGRYNLNFFCHRPPTPDAARAEAWRTLLRPYYEELGLDVHAPEQGASRQPFDAGVADVIEPFRPAIVSFHFGLPDEGLLQRVRAWGSKVFGCATTVDEAKWLAARGVDAVIAQGAEAGGHRGLFLGTDISTQVGTFALLPQIVQAVDVPVIAAGGIADHRGVEAALRLGASAVQVGTAFLLADEALTGALHRRAIASERARETAMTNLFTGRPARGIVNRLMRELGPINPTAPAFPSAAGAIMPLRVSAESHGRDDFTPLWCGQNASGCRAAPAGRIIQELVGIHSA